MRTLLALSAALIATAPVTAQGAAPNAAPQAASPAWVAAYAFPPSSNVGPTGPASAPNPNDPRGPLGPSEVSGVVLTQSVLVTASGERLRLRLSNAHGAAPVEVGGLTVELNGRKQSVLFDGQPSVRLPAGAPVLSDPVDLPVQALDRLKIAFVYPRPTALPVHRVRQTLRGLDGVESPPMRLGTLLAGVEVEAADPPGVIVALGDSITEGTGALPSGLDVRGWPERLAERLHASSSQPWAVVNAGIGGNRLLHQGSGPSGLERLDEDALTVSGGRCLILLEGINDIGRPARQQYAHEAVTPGDLIAGYRQVMARARAAGFKVVLATLPPFEGANYFTAGGEQTRQAVNAWLRSDGAREADAIVDFDAAVRDPARPSRFRRDFHSGDWLHPSDAGYQAMAEAAPMDVCD
jgi:lysophospholipase L1-like esterase